jgi:serine O-acetyltransferase
VVGIPGRVIAQPETKKEKERAAMAKKIGFEAYGVTSDMPDPVAEAIHKLLDHMHAVDGKINNMCEVMEKHGIEGCSERLPELEDDEFDSVGGTD